MTDDRNSTASILSDLLSVAKHMQDNEQGWTDDATSRAFARALVEQLDDLVDEIDDNEGTTDENSEVNDNG